MRVAAPCHAMCCCATLELCVLLDFMRECYCSNDLFIPCAVIAVVLLTPWPECKCHDLKLLLCLSFYHLCMLFVCSCTIIAMMLQWCSRARMPHEARVYAS